MSSSSVSLLVTIVVGLGVISAGVWRVAAAVLRLAAKVDLLAYRIEQVEKRPLTVAVPARRRRPSGGQG